MTFKSVPVKSCGDEGVVKRASSNDVESRDRRDFDVAEKVSNQRNIPVKQIESHHVKNNTMDSEKSPNSTPLSETSQNIEETVAAPRIN